MQRMSVKAGEKAQELESQWRADAAHRGCPGSLCPGILTAVPFPSIARAEPLPLGFLSGALGRVVLPMDRHQHGHGWKEKMKWMNDIIFPDFSSQSVFWFFFLPKPAI